MTAELMTWGLKFGKWEKLIKDIPSSVLGSLPMCALKENEKLNFVLLFESDLFCWIDLCIK